MQQTERSVSPLDDPTHGHPEHVTTVSRILHLPIIRTIADAIKSYGRLIIYRPEFRWLWLASVVSTIGNFLTHIAIVNIIERVFKDDPNISGTAVSGIFLSAYIPPILLMPITGVLADVLDRRKVMLASDVMRMLIVLLFNITLFDEKRLYWLLYVVETCMWALNSFFDPCREGLVPLVVKKNELVTANALGSVTWMCCSFIGSFLGGLIVATLGEMPNFILDSCTFLISSILIAQLFRYSHLHPNEIKKTLKRMAAEEIIHIQGTHIEDVDTPSEAANMELIEKDQNESKQVEEAITEPITRQEYETPTPELTQLEEIDLEPIHKESFIFQVFAQVKEFVLGFRFLFKHPYILSLVFVKAIGSIHWGSMDFVFLKMCYEVFQPEGQIADASWTYGVFRGLMGLGSGLMPVLVERSLPKGYGPLTMRSIIMACFFTFIGAYIIILCIRNVYAYFVAAFIINAFGGTLWNMSMSILQQKCPNNFLGRVLAVDIGFNLNISQALTFLIYGPLLYDTLHLNAFWLSIVSFIMGIVSAVIYVIWWIATKRISNDTYIVDDQGNDIVKQSLVEAAALQSEVLPQAEQVTPTMQEIPVD
jgi:MFS family permease